MTRVTTRVRLLRSAEQDLDALAHVRAIREGAEVVREDRPVGAEWSLIARAAAMLWSGRGEADVLVTVGDAALCAASLAPRWPTIHVPVGTPTSRERRLLATRLSHARVAVGSRSSRAVLHRAGVQASRIEIIGAFSEASRASRDSARGSLGLDDATTLVHVPGRIGPDSGHRLALYACAILAYAEPAWRHLASARGDVGHAERFIASTAPSDVVRVARGVDDATLAAAADVALFCQAGAPERVAIDAAWTSGAAIVAPARLWRDERLPTDERVRLFDGRKARAVARAMLDAADATPRSRRSPIAADGRDAWASMLRTTEVST